MGLYILGIIVIYFAILLFISYIVGRKHTDNNAFFRGNRQSPWYIVAVAMIGTSISGVTFVSVPGMVGNSDMTYMQMVFGFFIGYIVIAYVLLPIYYKLNLTTIYGYLHQRFGICSYKTGASFFILSKLVGSSAKLYLVASILQNLVFNQWDIPFYITLIGIIVFIWAYTFRSGIKAIIWTDFLQTVCLILALVLIIWQVIVYLDFGFKDTFETIVTNEHSRIFVFDDWFSKNNFFKQFFSGILITIVMTGLDQDMMQKNMTCKNLKEAQKNMLTYGFAFIPINFLFLSLGILLLVFASHNGIVLPVKSDQILPFIVTEYLGLPVLIFFTIGIMAAAFSSADSAITSLTTSFCIDLLNVDNQDERKAKRTRILVHTLISVCFIVFILFIDYLGQSNVLDTIYTAASYTYGPLLGMFFLGLFTKINLRDKYVPIVCILSPILSYLTNIVLLDYLNYQMGYEVLLLNALFTIIGLCLLSIRNNNKRLISES